MSKMSLRRVAARMLQVRSSGRYWCSKNDGSYRRASQLGPRRELRDMGLGKSFLPFRFDGAQFQKTLRSRVLGAVTSGYALLRN
jgi:hypothetical protein